MRKLLLFLFCSVLAFAQQRSFSPTLRVSSGAPLTITQVDGNFTGLANIGNAASRVYFAANSTAMLALSPPPIQGDSCWRTDTLAMWVFAGGDPTNVANWSTNYTEGTWTPTFTSLTVVNGTGGVTYAGVWRRTGKLVWWTVVVTPTGTATSASTANTTFISNLPFAVGVASTCTAVNASTLSYGVGYLPPTATNAFTPTWAAINLVVVINGSFSL